MGRIKELLEKKAEGTITEAEAKELAELQAEAKEADVETTEESNDEEEKAINDLVANISKAVTERVSQNISDAQEKSSKVEVTKEAKYIVDPKLGRKSVDELADMKVVIPGRNNKQNKELSMKSMHFIEALATNNVEKIQVLVEGTGARGGFLVPDDYANMIVEDLRDATVMRQLADVITTTSDTLHLPNLAARPKATWRSEAAVKNTSTVDFGETVFTPYSLATIVSLSDELVADASLGVNGSIVNYVTQAIVQSLAEEEDNAFWTGSGSGQPTGVTQYNVGTIASGITDTARADAIIQTLIRLPQGYRSRAAWVMNSQTLEKVSTLKDSQNNYLLGSLEGGTVMTLRGRPVYEQNDLPVGTIYLGDWSYYKIVDREGIRVRVSDEATVASYSGFERDLTHIRVEKRVDGELTLTGAVRSVTGIGTP